MLMVPLSLMECFSVLCYNNFTFASIQNYSSKGLVARNSLVILSAHKKPLEVALFVGFVLKKRD